MITREELYRLVWSQPMTKTAEQFGVSGSYMARVCSILRVPRPPVGYWAKAAVGKASTAEPLPPARPGDQQSWSEKGGYLRIPAAAPQVLSKAAKPGRRSMKPRTPAQDVHPLLRGTRSEFMNARPGKPEVHLKPYKQLLPDVTTSEASLDRALGLANKLYNELEALGGCVVIAPKDERWARPDVEEREIPKESRSYHFFERGLWRPLRPTVVFFDGLAIGLAVLEMTEDVPLRYFDGSYIRETEYQANPRRYQRHHTWTTNGPLPSGRFRIAAFSPYGSVKWIETWQEKTSLTLEKSLSGIARKVRSAVPNLAAKIEEEQRKAEIRHQEWLIAEDKRQREADRRAIEESETKSRERLGKVIEAWADRTAVERFFDEVSKRIDHIPGEERADLVERLRMAREFMGTQDPLDFFRTWRTPREIYPPRYEDENDQAS